jgi:hypothetical protein
MERIVGVAIRLPVLDTTISMPAPYRHHNIIKSLDRLNIKFDQRWEQGFITSEGRFVNRTIALHMVLDENGVQKIIGPIRGKQLYSENLW